MSTLDFRNVTSLFFIEPYNVAPGFYKTHDLITEFVRSRRSDILEHCTRIAADYCSVLIKQDQSDNSVAFLYAPLLRACSLCKANAELHTKLILIGYWMYDKGMWNELMSAFDDSEVKPSTGSFEIARFFYGMCMRRREGVKAGQRILSSISRNAIVADYLPFPLEIELAYLNALSGDYGLARHQISDIHSRVHIFDFTNRTHAKCRLYYCDLLILDGQFLTASMLLQEVLDREDHISVLDRAEFIRSRGHASRLSFQLEEAETLYLLALRHAAGSPAIEAKLLTNLAETFAITRPTRARTEALTAMDINYRLGNVIEVGKCEVVLAIASAAVGQLHSASDHCTRAHIIFQNANYKAGLLFAEIANCLIAWKSSRKADAYSALKKCGIFVEEMGVYKSLLLVPAMLLTDTASVEEIMKDTQWLERHEVTAVVNDALSQFLNS